MLIGDGRVRVLFLRHMVLVTGSTGLFGSVYPSGYASVKKVQGVKGRFTAGFYTGLCRSNSLVVLLVAPDVRYNSYT